MLFRSLVGDKFFYGYGYDDNYRMQYAYVDVNTKEKEKIKTSRIDDILGYDGNFIYYKGVDEKEGNILGRVGIRNGKDETVASYAEVDEEGYVESVSFADGVFYCLTLAEKTDSYDYRTYTYRLQIRDGETGKVEKELPVDFTGSARSEERRVGKRVLAGV